MNAPALVRIDQYVSARFAVFDDGSVARHHPHPDRFDLVALAGWVPTGGDVFVLGTATVADSTGQWHDHGGPLDTPAELPRRGLVDAAASAFNTYLVDSAGVLWGRGSNEGRLGIDGDVAEQARHRFVPLPVDDVVGVVAQSHATAALDAHGTLWAVGDNHVGCLGTGDTEHCSVFTRVRVPAAITSAALSSSSGAAVDDEGGLWVWGDSPALDGPVATPTRLEVPVWFTDVVASPGGGLAYVDIDGRLWTPQPPPEADPAAIGMWPVPGLVTSAAGVSLGEYRSWAVDRVGDVWFTGYFPSPSSDTSTRAWVRLGALDSERFALCVQLLSAAGPDDDPLELVAAVDKIT